MAKKISTIKLNGGKTDYAKVASRVKEFRTECPHGSIDTKPTILEDGSIMFSAIIIKDLSDEFSARATGTALSKSKNADKEKDFEKLETIAVGRALALLGYGADGEIASSDEMEEFHAFQDKKKSEVEAIIKVLQGTKTVDELKEKFLNCGMLSNADVINMKNVMYNKLKTVVIEVPKKKAVKKATKVEEGEVDTTLLPPDLQ